MWSTLEKPRPGVILPVAYLQNLRETPIQVFAGGIDTYIRADRSQPATRRTADTDKTGRLFRIVMALGATITGVLLLIAFRKQITGILRRIRKGPLAQTGLETPPAPSIRTPPTPSTPTRAATPPRATPPPADRTATPLRAETPTPTESGRSRAAGARLGTIAVHQRREEALEWAAQEKRLVIRPYLEESWDIFTPDQVEQLKVMEILELRFMAQHPVQIQIDAAALETAHYKLVEVVPSLKWTPDINVHRTACQILKWVKDNRFRFS